MAGRKKTPQAGNKPSAHFCRTKTRLPPHLKCHIGPLLPSHPLVKMPDVVSSARIALHFPCVVPVRVPILVSGTDVISMGTIRGGPRSAGSSLAPLPRPAFFHPFEQFPSQPNFDSREIHKDRRRAQKRSIFFCASSRCPLGTCT